MATGKALICKLGKHIEIPGADRIVQVDMFGETVITQKGNEEGTIGLLFDMETQLSHEFASKNNMYRHFSLNEDKKTIGYLEDDRRIRPVRLKGVKCSALFMPIDSLYSIHNAPEDYLNIGQEIDSFDGVQICEKYISKATRRALSNKEGKAKLNLVPTFKEHIDTDQWSRNSHKVKEGDLVIITEKLHGTSGRCGLLKTKIKNGKLFHLFTTIGAFFETGLWLWEDFKERNNYKFVVGSRKVVKSIGRNEKTNNKINWDRLEFNGRKDQVNRFLKYDLKEQDYDLYRKVFPETTKGNEITLSHVDSLLPGFKTYFENFDSGYYNENLWTKISKEQFEGKLRKGETVYFEIVGYTPSGELIMPSVSNEKLKKFLSKEEYKEFVNRYGETTTFNYGCLLTNNLSDTRNSNLSEKDVVEYWGKEVNQYKVFVYRITMTNEDGDSLDLSWEQVKTRCEKLGVNHVTDLYSIYISKNSTETSKEYLFDFIKDKVEELTNVDSKEFPNHIREGVCIRIENGNTTPLLLKNKSFIFKVLEGIIKDTDVVDIEESN